MKVRATDPSTAHALIDPDTKRSPFVDATTKNILEHADVPENNFWTRRMLAGEIERVPEPAPRAVGEHAEHADRAEPTGREPIAPLTTRDRR
jgi:hypothetical protein